jgi:hypothetical protein
MNNVFKTYADSLIQGQGVKALPPQHLAQTYVLALMMAKAHDAGALPLLGGTTPILELVLQVEQVSMYAGNQLRQLHQV